jgi:small conductance mechanosensitive channel
MTTIIETLQSFVVTYGLNIVGAILIIIIGRWAAGLASNLLQKALTKADVDASLVKFTGSLVYVGILIFAALAAVARLGIQTTSFIAVLGAAGLAVGLALQGALANFAAGVLLLLFRPYKVGDLVEVAGVFGRAEEIQIFTTVLGTGDNKTVIIPNGQVTSGNIVNYSTKGLLRLDMTVGIGYDDDLLKAKSVLEEIVTAHERVAKDPAPAVKVMELADNSVNFAVRPFVDPNDYWGVHFDITEQVKLRFDQEGISFPFPQRDIHVISNQNGNGLAT